MTDKEPKDKKVKESQEAQEIKENKLEYSKEELEKIRRERDEYLDGWKRSKADFLNYKKEEAEKIRDIFKYANEEILIQLIPVIDNFERAGTYLTEEQKREDCIKGLMFVKDQLLKILKENGLEAIDIIGRSFNPNTSEAMEEVEGTGKESGTVIEEIIKGYTLNKKLSRAAQVKVAK